MKKLEELIDEALADYEKALKEDRFGPGAELQAQRVRQLIRQAREGGRHREIGDI